MNQISADHEKLRNVLISKLGLPTDRFQRDNLIAEAVSKLITERDDALKLKGLVITDMDGNTLDWEMSEGVVEIPHSTQPQLNEIRYVLHGDIQPCTVLYSDDTTTLLRLDEGDIMCETDTIEWSDSVTYRCQELLRGFVGLTVSAKFTHHTMHAASAVMAQLVRDERIVLNDDALETVSDEPCVECNLAFDKNAVTCPVCNTIRPTPLR